MTSNRLSLNVFTVTLLLIIMFATVPAVNAISTAQTFDIEQESLPDSVAILVIDDFGNYRDLEEQLSDNGNCTMTLNGQVHGRVRGMGLIAGLAEPRVRGMFGIDDRKIEMMLNEPHGKLVYGKFLQLFNAATLEYSTTGSDEFGLDWMGEITAWETEPGAPNIFLVQIDTGGYNTGIITQNIIEAIGALKGFPWEIDRFVLNMSFGVLPCNPDDLLSVYEDYVLGYSDLEDLNRLLCDLGAECIDLWLLEDGFPDEETLRNFLLGLLNIQLLYGKSENYVVDMLSNDPLVNFLMDPWDADTRVISVASAGNSSKDYPFVPALWHSVISVSAPPLQGGDSDLDYSNDGEIIMNGDFDGIPGTSFAAPELSYLAALYLQRGQYQYTSQGAVTCSGKFTTSPPLTYGQWNNLPLADENNTPGAVSLYCDDFLGTSATLLMLPGQILIPPIQIQPPGQLVLPNLLDINSGTISLEAGFSPDPYQIPDVVGGGEEDLRNLGADCYGFASGSPTLSLDWDGYGFLRFFFVSEYGDTTLGIKDPAGNWYCNDDSFDTWNPTIDFRDAQSGQYGIWVGSYDEGEYPSGTLYITEIRDNNPTNVGSR